LNTLLQRLYNSSPVLLQNLAISLFGYKWNKRRFGGNFKIHFEGFKKRESFNRDDWNTYINSQLQQLLTHAYSNVPYYSNLLNQLGYTETSLQTFNTIDLKKIPYLEKNTLRQFGQTDLLSKKREAKGEFYASSGSTGTPTSILFSANMHQKWSAAFEKRIRNWAGLSIKDARGMIGGRRIVAEGDSKGPFFRYNFVEKQIYFSAYHINANNTLNYVSAIEKYKPKYMTGYAMSNYFLARFIEEAGIKVKPLQAVITSSEKLTQEMRDTFERVYHCKTYDSYSGVEACSLISECEHGTLHVSEDVGFIEFIKEDGSDAKPGEVGEMICTGFLNYDQPLIRYRIGDMARLSNNQQCACGRDMPIIDEIVGRVEDTVIGPDGREMVRFHGIFINLPSVVEGQIIQHTLNQFEIKLVVSQTITEQELATIRSRMESQLGVIALEINIVPFIERNANGKFKAVISHIKRTT
jgi:phenylacetate-CoA ligase